MTGDSFGLATKTEFNSNLATLIRIDKILKQCSIDLETEDWQLYFRHLRALKQECLYKMSHKRDKEGKCIEKCLKCFARKKFEKIRRLYEVYKRNKKDYGLEQNFSQALDDFENFLRDFMETKGMLLRDELTDDETPEEW